MIRCYAHIFNAECYKSGHLVSITLIPSKISRIPILWGWVKPWPHWKPHLGGQACWSVCSVTHTFFLSSTDNSNCERPVSSPQAHQPTGPPASWPNSSTESITVEHSSRGGCMFASGLGSLGSIHGREYVQLWTRMVLPLVLGEWMRSSLLRTGQQTCGTCTNVVYINNLLADGRWKNMLDRPLSESDVTGFNIRKEHHGQAAVMKWCDVPWHEWLQHLNTP